MSKALALSSQSRIVLCVLGILGSLLLGMVWKFNQPLFLLINGWHGALADSVLGVISGLGDGLVATLLLTSLMLWRFRAGVAGISAFIMSGLMTQFIKHIFNLPRPPVLFDHVHLLGARLTSHSFPSGHAATDGTMVALCLYLWGVRNWKALLGAFIFILASYGRIYGGVHFPFDVLVGLLLGFFSMVLCWRWFDESVVGPWAKSAWGWRVPAMLLITEAAVLGVGYRMHPSTAQVLAPVLSVSALVWVALSLRIKGDYRTPK